MCGICGIYSFEGEPIDKMLVKSMCDAISYRGPDDEGYFIDKNLALGMRRLSIIDLDTGRQPIHNEDESIWVVFNGEIYNFLELKGELEKKGHRFYTNSDTEAIVHAYEEYGTECLNKFNGMFAFALWDSNKKRLFIARDRFGVKPLHYYIDKSKFVFGSEIKSILTDISIKREVNSEALQQYLALEYVPAPLTMFKGINKLPPGHYLVLENNTIKIEKYWDLNFNPKKNTKQLYAAKIRQLLKDSVRKRLISDVPFGAFLSGGIDSSAIVCFMSELMQLPVKTFSIGFDEESYNETKYAKIIAEKFNTEHHEQFVDSETIRPLFDEMIPLIDEPLGDPSIFPTYLVSKFARKHVTMVLSGDGGDELLAGYDWYVANKLSRYYQLVPGHKKLIPLILKKIKPTIHSKGIINKAKKFTEGFSMPRELGHVRWMTAYDKRLSASETIDPYYIIKSYSNKRLDKLSRAQYIDIKTYLADDILTKVDRATMYTSLEARNPFLDYRLAELAAQIPSNLRLKGMQTKYILKKAMNNKLPDSILNKRKQGFTMPLKHWSRKELKDIFAEKLSESNLNRIGHINPAYANKLLTSHMDRTADNHRKLWAILSFVMWHENYIGNS